MHLDLVFPPLTGVTYPYLSTPVLAAYVRQESEHTVTQCDLNLRVVNHLLEPGVVAANVAAAEAFAARMARRDLHGADVMRFVRCAMAATSGPAIVAALPRALATVRSPAAVLAPREIELADRVIAAALDVATALAPPNAFDLGEPIYASQAADPAGLRRGVLADEGGFAGWYDELIGDDELRGGAVGLSIVYQGQVLPALTLARWLREHRPEARVIVGGPFFTAHRDVLGRHVWLFDLVDAFVVFEGEQPLVRYLDAVASDAAPEPIAGVVDVGAAVAGEIAAPLPIPAADLPCPDFDGLDLAAYHAPAPVLPLLASRGCYWRCAFCTHHYIYGNSYRVRPKHLIAQDVARLRDRHGCRHFYFVDESVSPKLIRHLTGAMAAAGEDTRWGCELRLEKSLSDDDLAAAARSGCRVLSFGLESASQRVLDLMNKGILVSEVRRVLGGCAAAGIHAHVMCIIGFPGEHETDAAETEQFVTDHLGQLDMVGFSYFVLLRNSPVQLDPGAYGVRAVRELVDGFDLEERLAFEVDDGLGRAEAFDRWLGVLRRPAVTIPRRRAGHAQRERFLFSPGRDQLLAEWALGHDAPAGAMERELATGSARALHHEHDLVALMETVDAFAIRAGRDYNVAGVWLNASWDAFCASARSAPTAGARALIFLPDGWSFVDTSAGRLAQLEEEVTATH